MLCVLKIAFTVIEYMAAYWNKTAQLGNLQRFAANPIMVQSLFSKEENDRYWPYSLY